jgi:hypothetical protein
MVREYFDKPGDMPRSWGYQSIAPTQAYRDGYDRIRWSGDEGNKLSQKEREKDR